MSGSASVSRVADDVLIFSWLLRVLVGVVTVPGT
jgi:hypothetical protein